MATGEVESISGAEGGVVVSVQVGPIDEDAYRRAYAILESALWRRLIRQAELRTAEDEPVDKEDPPPGIARGGGW